MKMKCSFDPNDEQLIRYALEVGKPDEVRDAIEHAADGFRKRLLRVDGTDAVFLLRPATIFDGAVIRIVLQEIADRENRQIDIHWIENKSGATSPDIEWVKE